MPGSFRIGVLGLTHDHVWGVLRQLREVSPQALVAVADPNRPLLERAQQEFACAIYREYQSLLDREKLDAVYVYADNATSVDLGEMAAERGLHVLVEKPLAASLAGADRLLAAVRSAGVRLMVNWPFAWWPQLQHALVVAHRGDLGALWQVKYRSAHEGPRELGCSEYFCRWLFDHELNGAGALVDYCCYGAALACCLLGLPSRVTAVTGRLRKEDILVEDNGVILMSYPRAIAIAEGSWTQVGKLTAYVTAIYGTTGTLLVEPRAGGRLLWATADDPDGREVNVPDLAPHLRNASVNFLHGLQTGEPFAPLCQARLCRDAQEVLEAGILSAESGSEVSLPLKTYT